MSIRICLSTNNLTKTDDNNSSFGFLIFTAIEDKILDSDIYAIEIFYLEASEKEEGKKQYTLWFMGRTSSIYRNAHKQYVLCAFGYIPPSKFEGNQLFRFYISREWAETI